MSNDKSYCGFIAIVGRPNVGKSTLLNKLLGQKISITSRKAQTTRHRIVGIHTEGAYQAIYVDTPGLHMEEKRAINRLMNKAASSSIGDVELVIFVVEGTRWTPDDEMVLNKLRDGKAPVILAVNKVDNVQEKADLLERALDICMYEDKKLKITGREDGCTCSEFGDYVMETVRKISE